MKKKTLRFFLSTGDSKDEARSESIWLLSSYGAFWEEGKEGPTRSKADCRVSHSRPPTAYLLLLLKSTAASSLLAPTMWNNG